MLLPLKKEKNSFTLKLHKHLYRRDIIKKAVSEDKGWVKEMPVSGSYFRLKLATSKVEDVFDWMNYLIYLHRD